MNTQIKPKTEHENVINIIWIDGNIQNQENIGYYNRLYETISSNCYQYKIFALKGIPKLDEAIDFIKTVKFEATIIIVAGSLYYNFIDKFIDNINNIYTIPKIIIFTKNKSKLKQNPELKKVIDNQFFNFGGIHTSFEDIKDFILKQIRDKIISIDNTGSPIKNQYDDDKLMFEYIDKEEKLLLPMFYKVLIDSNPSYSSDQKFIKHLYNQYNNTFLKNLLKPIIPIPTQDIPKQLLSKYYARIYTYESDFYNTLNKDLRNNEKIDDSLYLPFIKTLYKGVELESLPLASNNNILYRGTIVSIKEIEEIKLHKKIFF